MKKYNPLTENQWKQVCDAVDLKSFPSTMMGRDGALCAKAKEMFPNNDVIAAPESINFKLRKRERKAGFFNPAFTIETLTDGRRVRVGTREV